nr:hypothetical protein [Tanacetum cinerariifolium]
ERRYFRTVATTYAQEVAHSRDYCARIIEALRREVKNGTKEKDHEVKPGTTPVTTPSTTTTSVTNAQLQAMINEGINAVLAARDATRNDDDSHTSGTEEVDKIKNYIGGLPDMILGSVKASRSKTMQEVIEFTTELMEDKTRAYAERQADNKRKSEDIARNNQNQQPYKRQNTGQAYTV